MIKMKQLVTALTVAAVAVTTPLPAFAANTGTITAKPGSVLSQADNDYHERRRYRHRDRIDGGDILAGIGILAGIAILADAASSSSKKQRRRDRNPDYDDMPQQPQRSGSSYNNGNDVGSAVTACSGAAERSAGNNARVDEIRSVTRAGAGWQVEGNLRGNDNSNFSCGVTNGQIEFVRLNGRDI